MSVFLAIEVSLVVRESAVAWLRSATGAVTMMTRHPIALRTHTHLDICIDDGGAWGSAVVMSTVVRVGAVTLVTTVTICCDSDVEVW